MVLLSIVSFGPTECFVVLPGGLFSCGSDVLSGVPYVLCGLGAPGAPIRLLRLYETVGKPMRLISILSYLCTLGGVALGRGKRVRGY